MTDKMTWQTMLDRAARRGMLGKQLYVVRSNPANGLGPVVDNLERHVAHQMRLEAEGVIFAAGPLASEDEQQWLGEGMFIYRASSLDEAVNYAAADPMHQSGARDFRVRTWLLNEGSANLKVFFSNGRSVVF